jgi:carbamoyltransferase
MIILGVHHGHDSSAALISNGIVLASAAEERFSRIKNDNSFPINAIDFCLAQAKISSVQVDAIAIPGKTHTQELEAFFDLSEVKGLSKNNLGVLKNKFKRFLNSNSLGLGDLPLYQPAIKVGNNCKLIYCGHHLSHAASAYYTGHRFDSESLIITMDGHGEGISTAVWSGKGKKIKLLKSFDGGGSLGWLYGNATEALGWRHGSDEWKVMGLAPYGFPKPDLFKGLHPVYSGGDLVKSYKFSPFKRWDDHGASHWHSKDAELMRERSKHVSKEDYAAEIQRLIEEQALELVVPWLQVLKTRSLYCAGGAFLNIKLNQRIWDLGILDKQWIFPDAGDAGLSVGAALYAFHLQNERAEIKPINNIYWGPSYEDEEIRSILNDRGISYSYNTNPTKVIASFLAKNYVIGWFQGRMEAGPRALGNRSILMSPLHANNKDIVNAKVKYREGFRPFCPSILEEYAKEYLTEYRDERYMTTSFNATLRAQMKIPAVVHVDNTVRPQIVSEEQNPRYHDLINSFGKLTGEYALLNTSFNVKGEPVVCNPREAIKCFFDTGLDILCIGNFIVKKPALNN